MSKPVAQPSACPPRLHDVGEGLTVHATCEECLQLAARVCPDDVAKRRFIAGLLHGTAPDQREPEMLLYYVDWLETSRDFGEFCERLSRCGVIRVEGGYKILEPQAGDAASLRPADHVAGAELSAGPSLDKASLQQGIQRLVEGDGVWTHPAKHAAPHPGGKP